MPHASGDELALVPVESAGADGSRSRGAGATDELGRTPQTGLSRQDVLRRVAGIEATSGTAEENERLARMAAQWAERFPRVTGRGYITTAIDEAVVLTYEMRFEEWRALPEEVRADYRRTFLRLNDPWGFGNGREEHHI